MAAVHYLPKGSRRITTMCEGTIGACEAWIAARERTDPKGVRNGDYTVDMTPAEDAVYQRHRARLARWERERNEHPMQAHMNRMQQQYEEAIRKQRERTSPWARMPISDDVWLAETRAELSRAHTGYMAWAQLMGAHWEWQRMQAEFAPHAREVIEQWSWEKLFEHEVLLDEAYGWNRR
jgi:hypothetical protein